MPPWVLALWGQNPAGAIKIQSFLKPKLDLKYRQCTRRRCRFDINAQKFKKSTSHLKANLPCLLGHNSMLRNKNDLAAYPGDSFYCLSNF